MKQGIDASRVGRWVEVICVDVDAREVRICLLRVTLELRERRGATHCFLSVDVWMCGCLQ